MFKFTFGKEISKNKINHLSKFLFCNKNKFRLSDLFKKDQDKLNIQEKTKNEQMETQEKKETYNSLIEEIEEEESFTIVKKESKPQLKDAKKIMPKMMNKNSYEPEKVESQIKNLENIKINEDADNSTLQYLSKPILVTKNTPLKQKWQIFFTKTSRILPDFTRSLNNQPDELYLDFVEDLRLHFNEKQLLFALKNIFLHCPPHIRKISSLLLREIHNRVFVKNNFNLYSKLNLLMIFEALHLFPMSIFVTAVKKNNFNDYIYHDDTKIIQILNACQDTLRIFSSHLTSEEFIFSIKVFLDKNLYDSFMINLFFENYSLEQIVNIISKNEELIYRIKYFNNEINLSLTLLKIIEKYVLVQKLNLISIEELEKLKIIVENSIIKFIESVEKNKHSLDQIFKEDINFNILLSIFDIDKKNIFKNALNNVILNKINTEINLDNTKSTSLTTTYSINLMSKMEKNSYNTNLFEKNYNKLCELSINSFYENKINNSKEATKEVYKEIIITNSYHEITKLFEICIKSNNLNKNIIYPFLFLLNRELGTIQADNMFRSEMLILFSQFKFNDFFKKHSDLAQNLEILNIYFKILSKIQWNVDISLENTFNIYYSVKANDKFRKEIFIEKENDLSYINLCNDKKAYELCKTFYQNFNEVNVQKDEETFALHYEEDVIIDDQVVLSLMMFKNLPKDLNLRFYISEYNLLPTTNITTDLFKDNLILYMENLLDYFNLGINYKLIKAENVRNFILLINNLFYIAEIEDSNIYELAIKPALLNNKNLYEKMLKVINFILTPQTNIDLISEYDIKNYNINENLINQHKLHKINSTLSSKIFKKDEIKEFMNEFYKKDKSNNIEVTIEEVENSNKIFLNLLNENTNLYNDLDQLLELKNNTNLFILIQDMHKISETMQNFISENIDNNFEKLQKIYDNFYVSDENKSHLHLEFKLKNNNLSKITVEEILTSKLFYDYLESFLNKNTISKYDDKNLNQNQNENKEYFNTNFENILILEKNNKI